MVIDTKIARLRGRIAEAGIRHADLAKHLGIHPTLFSAIITGRRDAPVGFATRAHATLDRLEAAEKAAAEARERVLAETEEV